MCYRVPERDGMSSRPLHKANHEPLLGDAAGRAVCFRCIPMTFLVAAEPPMEGMQLWLVPLLSFPQGPSTVCFSSCCRDDGQVSVKAWQLLRAPVGTSCQNQAAKAVPRWGEIQPHAMRDGQQGHGWWQKGEER